MKFDTSLLKTNNRGLINLENVCVHEDGYEAKVSVPDSMCMYGKGTLHLYVAQNNKFIRPDLVAAYISHEFKKGNLQTNVDMFFEGGFNVEIPAIWVVDGFQIVENTKIVCCHRTDQTKDRYKNRGLGGEIDSIVEMPRCIKTDDALRHLIRERVQNRVYKRDCCTIVEKIFNAIKNTLGLERPRADYDRAISMCMESKDIKPLIDKPTRDKVRQNYRASDHVRNRTTNLASMIKSGHYGAIRG